MFLSFDAKIYLASQPVDLRKSSQTLSVWVKNVLCKDPLCGHLFIFYNKRKDLIKILYWQTNGFCLWQKKLQKGVFSLPSVLGGHSVEINAYHLHGLIQGLEGWHVKRAKELQYQYVN